MTTGIATVGLRLCSANRPTPRKSTRRPPSTGRCTLLACDFDEGTWALDALAYLDACHNAEVPAALERSRSGNGAHVWVFFDDEVPVNGSICPVAWWNGWST